MAHLITEDNLGAWLIKCDPELNSDVPRQIGQPGTGVVTTWCVARNYRSRMMKPGDRAILWVSGNGRRLTRGIWGVGWVTGHVQDTDAESGLPVANQVSLDISLFERGAELSSTELLGVGITDLEVQKQAHMSNPSWVTKDQLARIEVLLPPWPDHVGPGEGIPTSDPGPGLGNPIHTQ
ncbi:MULTISPECIES: hypothetical protein [unclassified Knoellia]|uniref:hypothetical protein n=1 Tax=Knoellia altitudinis TaxID=3404795 RepID=UPI003619FEFA